MTCRHAKGDPDCSSSPNYVAPYSPPKTPDSKNYQIEDVERVGSHLVLKVRYPNCLSCMYEGTKVMVYLNVSEKEVLQWNEIDPHFSEPKRLKDSREAPSPAGRFPGSTEGWYDAVDYASRKST